MFVPRRAQSDVERALSRQASVALIGPRQVGKTTLALDISNRNKSIYLDLERASDRRILEDHDDFFLRHRDSLVILDEVQRTSEIFGQIRGAIDRARRSGVRTGMFLFLGSTSMELLRQGSESLAGRISYVNLDPINVVEAVEAGVDTRSLWLRGGFPDSLSAQDDSASFSWRTDFIRTYIERDIPFFSGRLSMPLLEQLWTMLAHSQGSVLNLASLAKSLDVSSPTVRNYIELLEKMLLVRRLRPFRSNIKKQYVKSPKIYVRDSGLVHALLGLRTELQLLGHPVVGLSWEGFVIENLLNLAPVGTQASFYRTAKGAEIDLILQPPGFRTCWAIEIKRNIASRVKKGFYYARNDIRPSKSFVVHSGEQRFPMDHDIEAIGLLDMCKEVISCFSESA